MFRKKCSPYIGHVTPAPLPRPSDAVVARMLESDRQERKREFVRETAARIVVADAQRDRFTCLEQDVDVAEKLAEILSERGYL